MEAAGVNRPQQFVVLIKVDQNYSYVASTTAINNAAANHKLMGL